MSRETKQVIVARKDLNMKKGKLASQVAHASISFLTKKMSGNSGNYKLSLSKSEQEWLESGFTKICVYVESEEDLLEIYRKAKEKELEAHLITDSGKTEFSGVPTRTCLAIGPDYAEKIDIITGHLKLL